MSSFSALGMGDSARLHLKRLNVKRIRYAVGVLGPPLEIAVSR